ncbi:MAG: hypothetical protein KGZ45_02790 [Clostridium sp.]|nr:hypothetical protein [Clostridium sp.]
MFKIFKSQSGLVPGIIVLIVVGTLLLGMGTIYLYQQSNNLVAYKVRIRKASEGPKGRLWNRPPASRCNRLSLGLSSCGFLIIRKGSKVYE